jgi:hypothetical protein
MIAWCVKMHIKHRAIDACSARLGWESRAHILGSLELVLGGCLGDDLNSYLVSILKVLIIHV